MPEIAVVDIENLIYPYSLDSDHYLPERTKAIAQLQSHSNHNVGSFFDEIKKIRGKGELSKSNDVFDLTDSLGWLLRDTESTNYIGSSKKKSQAGDLIISRLRSYLEEIAIIPNRFKKYSPLLSTEYIVLRPKNYVDGSWLLPFLLSKQVQTVLKYTQTGSNHPRFSSFTLLEIPIPKSILKIRPKLTLMVNEAIASYEKSLKAYPDAELEMLERMEFDQLNSQSDKLWFIKELSAVNTKQRLDAEFFQPKHAMLRSHLKLKDALRIGDFCSELRRGIQPIIIEDGDVLVIDSKSVRPRGVSLSDDRTAYECYELDAIKKASIQKNDVLLNSTGVGTIGRASCYQLDKPAIADNHVTIIKPNEKKCYPAYLSLFLNSPAGTGQTEQYQSGSSGQIEIYPQHIVEFLIYLPRNKNGEIDIAWQHKLGNKAIFAGEALIEAKKKLKEAKKLVEKTILRH